MGYISSIVVGIVLFASCWISTFSCLKQMTPQQIEQLTRKHEFVLLLIGKRSEPMKTAIEKVEEELDEITPLFAHQQNLIVASLDVDKYPEVVRTYSVSSLPAIVLVRDGYPREYFGQRVSTVILSWLRKLLTTPPITPLDTKIKKKEFQEDEGVKVVAYFPDVNSAAYKTFELVAKHFQGEMSFWHVHDEKMAKSLKFKQPNTIAIFKPHEKTFFLNRPSSERQTLLSQLQPLLKPLYEELTFYNTHRIWDGELPKLTALIHGYKGTLSKRTISILRSLAKNYKDHFDFIVINAEIYREFLRVFGIRTEELPTFTIVHPRKGNVYKFPKEEREVTQTNVDEWVNMYLSGQLQPITTSTSAPLYTPDDPVIQLTDESLELFINIPERDAMVEFYAPWCVHCQRLVPEYVKLAKYFNTDLKRASGNQTIFIASFDADTYTVPPHLNINVTSFPTILFFPATNKSNPIRYIGQRDFLSMRAFVFEHASTWKDKPIPTLEQHSIEMTESEEGEEEDTTFEHTDPEASAPESGDEYTIPT